MPEPTELTASLANFVAGLDANDLPAKARDIALSGFIDCIAVLYAGWDAPAATHMRKVAGTDTWADPLQASGLPAQEEALHLAIAAHALDFDDTAIAGHPSAVLVPAILAELKANPKPGLRAIAAWVAGYEVWAELDAREPDPLHGKGWHPSAVYGPPAAAAAIASLRDLDTNKTQTAISIAASMTGGLVAQFGTWTKPWQLARAAQAGLVAASLAETGMEAAPDALEHPRGFLGALSPRGNARLDGPRAADLHVLQQGLNIKFYPVCYAMHRALDAAAELAADNDIDPAQVAAVDVEIGATQAGLLHYSQPETVAQARFSLQFSIAAILLRRKCGLGELADDFILSEPVRALTPKITMTLLEERSPDEPAHSPWDRVTIRMKDGSVLVSRKVDFPLGHFRKPAGPDALKRKFDDCLTGCLPKERADTLYRALADLPALASTTSLFELREFADA
ncbi:MmgE/PrpD family protein [Oricola sp.]|uniref:MmgE/PrpD family protein n=1 Tax=Oricola sp. TaxID=1979950 RepID=UPI0025FC1280|nr:MmgE/PrpD family protein [Oricola sp.]MCI5074135.1 MmgE/PrpD family protein [Oricola sp.]